MNKPDLKVAATAEIKIEKGVPMPTKGQSGHPWDKMDVGDSFVYWASRQGMFNAVDYRNKQNTINGSPVRFKASSKGGELRVWRIA